MRITNNIIQADSLASVQRGLQQVSAAQRKVSSGRKFERASEDPVAASTGMATRGSLRALDQYRRTIDLAKLRTSTEEQVLNEINDLLTRARELGISQAHSTTSAGTREAAQREVEGLLRHAVALGNTQLDGYYLFGGGAADVRPYAVDESGATLAFTSTDPTGDHKVEIGPQHQVLTNHAGLEIFGTTSSGVLAALRELGEALGTDDLTDLTTALSGLDVALDDVQGLIAEAGVRYNNLDIARANIEAVELGFLSLKSELEEVDIEEAVTDLVSRQTSYQAALLAASRVMGLTLTDYLR